MICERALWAPSIVGKFGVIAYSAFVLFIWLNYADNARFWIPYHNYLLDL